MMKKIKDVDLEALSPSLDCSPETLSKLQQAIPEVSKYITLLLWPPFSCVNFLAFVYTLFNKVYELDLRILAEYHILKCLASILS